MKSFFKSSWLVLKETYESFSRHDALRLAAALSYYTVFSIGPLLLIAIAAAGFIFGEEAIHGELSNQLRGLMGTDGAKAVEDIVANAHKPKTGLMATIIGVVVLIVGATAVFSELQASLNKVWEVKPEKIEGIAHYLRTRLLSFAMVLSIGFLLLVSLVINSVLSAVSAYFSQHLSVPVALLQIPYNLFSFALIALLFALMFKVLPDIKLMWREVWMGAAITSVFFTIGKFLFGLYLGQSSVTSAFGASASVVLIMLWTYYSSVIVLLGAEFTKVYSDLFIKPKHRGENEKRHAIERT